MQHYPEEVCPMDIKMVCGVMNEAQAPKQYAAMMGCHPLLHNTCTTSETPMALCF